MERVRVTCRLRPAKTHERRDGLTCEKTDGQQVTLAPPDRSGQPPRVWSFDSVHGPESTQAELYEDVGEPILNAVMQGYNGTILAYGQTGAGKTHTLLNASASPAEAGLVPRLVAELYVKLQADVRHVYRVRASFMQIYNEQIDDLLKGKNCNLKLKPHGGGTEVEGLTVRECGSAEEMLALFEQGRKHLIYAETKLNKSSSRSHAVLQLHLSRRQRVLDAGVGSMETTQLSGKLSIVDLAGSERVKRSGADEEPSGRRMREAININTSLLGLSNVMKALAQGGGAYVPYRDSKLTHMLQDSLGGNCRTALVVCASPAAVDGGESAGTLDFGARAMKVKTHATINSQTVLLDAAALAADLSDALRLRPGLRAACEAMRRSALDRRRRRG